MRTQRSYAETGDAAAEKAILGEDETIDLLNVVGMLRRRKWLIMLVTALGTAAAAFLGMKQTPTYTATASVMLDSRQLQVTDVEQVITGMPISSATMATQIGLLRSRDFIAAVMSDLNLFNDPEFNPALAAAAAPPTTALPAFLQPLEQLIAQLPDEWLIATGLASQPQPVLESEAPTLARERAILRFMSGAVFLNDGQSYLIQVQFTSPDPDKAAVIANKIANRFVDDELKGKLTATDKASGWLEQRLAELKVEVQKSDQAVAKYMVDNNIVATGGGTLNDQELADLNGQLAGARAELADLQARLRVVRELRGSEAALESVSDVTNSPAILRLREQVTELERQESELRTLYGERHPRMLQLRDEKSKVASAIRNEVERVARTMENDVRVAASRVASIEGTLSGLKDRNTEDRRASVQLAELERVALANRTLYEQLLQRFNETRDQQGIVQADARVVAMAAPPAVPSSPGPKIFAAAGFTISLVLGSLLAILLERLDRGLRSAREVETALGLTTLGLVPRLDRLRRNQRPHQYLREKPLSSYAEAIRGVLTALKLSNPQNPPKVILVTSSLPEEGKTTFAVSLASLVARSQKRVLLIDLDLRHPSVHRELGWQVSAGLVEYMAGERTLQEVVHNDLETGLHFLPVKAHTTTPTDLLESDRMRQLLQVCRDNYDLVVLDSAPVASVNDTKVAANLADRVVFVVRWGKTIESAARDSLRSLREAGIEPAGAVLAQIDLRKHAQYRYGDIGQYYTRSRRYYVN
jgi:capsular exopolysaccharide synthesis family protein